MTHDHFLIDLKKAVESKKNLKEIESSFLEVLSKYSQNGKNKIGYVAGVVTSDGPEKIGENVKNLIKATEKIRRTNDYFIFSTVDIFNEKIVFSLEEHNLPSDEEETKFLQMWKMLIESGYITDIFMTKGWERSRGAKFENKTAKENDLKIHYFEC